jgi:hypothetical protein
MKKLGLVSLLCGLAIGAGYGLAFKAYCDLRPDGTYGELYGPMVFLRPYVISVVVICLILAAALWILGSREKSGPT